MKKHTGGCILAWAGFLAGFPAVLQAQVAPWDSFQDDLSNSVCSLINAGNAELVVLRATGELVAVGGSDVILEDTFVDASGFVFFEGQPAGLLDFATDGDGFRTLWWLTLTGAAIEIDPLTGEPQGGDFFPDDFEDVPCDACDFWDDPTICDLPPPTVRICGAGVPLVFAASLIGLMGLSLLRGRRLG